MTTQIEFGVGASRELPHYLAQLNVGHRLFVVSDPGVVKTGIVSGIQRDLEVAGYATHVFTQVAQNPRDNDCMKGAIEFDEFQGNAVLAIGGGSAMDTGKAIALIAKSGGTPSEYADKVRAYHDAFPVVCVPTTAGTGSDVTRSSVITEARTHRKMTLKAPIIRPRLAVLDPELTITVPRSVTAATGVDALVHAIEGYTCTKRSPVTQSFGAKAMRTIVPALPKAFESGADLAARSAMLEGSLLAGLCFGNADVASVHCLAEALGGLYDTPHGVANAIFLPHVLRFNAGEETDMHAEIARLMGFACDRDNATEAVAKMCAGIEEWTRRLQIPLLRDLPYVQESDFERLVELAFENGSTPSNVRHIGKQDYHDILATAWSAHR